MIIDLNVQKILSLHFTLVEHDNSINKRLFLWLCYTACLEAKKDKNAVLLNHSTDDVSYETERILTTTLSYLNGKRNDP